MKKVILSFLYLISISLFINADEVNLDNLLDTFAKNSDLSKQTKLENSGHTVIFTRDDLDRMMAKNLKDILKSYPIIGYRESRFGYPDILNMGSSLPFSSSTVRIMIDDHEVTTAFNGSGLALLGDIDLGFVDHVEIYALGPSFEHSSELTYILIKLYSKTPQRDMGSKVEVINGSYGYNFQSFYTADQLDKISYFTYVSHLDDKKKSYESFGYPINRDQERLHLFSSLYYNNHTFKIQAIQNNKGASVNYSANATPTAGDTKYKFYNVNYKYEPNDKLAFLFNYSKGNSKSYFANSESYSSSIDIKNLNLDVKEDILSATLKYALETSNNRFIVGTSSNIKRFDYTSFKLNHIEYVNNEELQKRIAGDYTKRINYNIFLENQYLINQNNVLTMGVKHDIIKNNGPIKDDEITLYRMGYTYSNKKFISKTFIYNTSSLIESSILKSNFADVDKNLEPQQLKAISQEFKYNFDNSIINLVSSYGILSNFIYQDGIQIKNSSEDMDMFATYINYDYIFSKYNKILFDISYNKSKDIPQVGDMSQYSGFIRGLHTVSKFDFFDEIIYRYDNIYKDDSYDLTLGINYHHTKDLKFYIKGENLLDKGYKDSFTRVTYEASNYIRNSNIEIAPIDKKVIIGLEYLF